MKITQKRNYLVASDWFDETFFGDFLGVENKWKTALNTKEGKISEKSISARVLTHWQKFGLISDDRPQGKGWRKFSTSERLWIHCIIRLRKFGLDLNKIKKVKEHLEWCSEKDQTSIFPQLDFYILFAMTSNTPVKLIVFADGETLIGRQIDIEIAKNFNAIKDDYISIDLNMLFNEGIKGKKKILTNYLNYSPNIQTEVEKELTNSINNKNIKSIKMTVDNGNEFHFDKEFILSSKQEMLILLNKLQYGEATTIKRGKKRIYKVTEKTRIKK